MSDNKTFVQIALIVFGFFTCMAAFITFNQYMHHSKVKDINRYELNVKFGPGRRDQKLIFEEHVIDE